MITNRSPRQQALHARYMAIGKEIAARKATRPAGFDQEGWSQLVREGLWSLVCEAPAESLAEAWWDFTAALEGLASSLRQPALLLSVIAQAGIIRALQRHGSPAQRRKYIDAVMTGRLSATAIAEPHTGTDVRSTHTTLTPDGEGFRLTGHKYNIAHAPVADFTLVVCRHAGPGEAISLVLMDNDSPGIMTGQFDRKLGNTDLPTGELHFDQVRVEPDQLLGSPRRGLRQLIDIISLGRLYYGLVAANIVRPFLQEAMDYADTRQSFKEPIVDHQYVQRRLVDIRIGLERSRWSALGALGQLLTDHPDAVLNCSVAKLVGSDDLIRSAVDLVRLYGSQGYHEGDISGLVRDALGFASVGGTEEMHRKNIFNQMTRLASLENALPGVQPDQAPPAATLAEVA